MPAIRPEAISNFIRLAYEVAAPVAAFVAEYGTVDSLLAAVVVEVSPHKARISFLCSQHHLFARPNKQLARAAILVPIGAVVPFVQLKAICIAVLRQPPMPPNPSFERTASPPLNFALGVLRLTENPPRSYGGAA